MTDRKSLNPDEMKQLSAWHTVHCTPGKRCDEYGDIFGDPFPCERLVSIRLTDNVFLLYAVCRNCTEHSASNPERRFPNCDAQAETISDRIVVLPVADQQAVS
jgi:hypothetical protein